MPVYGQGGFYGDAKQKFCGKRRLKKPLRKYYLNVLREACICFFMFFVLSRSFTVH